MEEQTQWIAIGEAAKYLGVSKDTLRRWEKAGKLQVQRSPTNRRYYTKSQLDELISQRNVPISSIPPKIEKTDSSLSVKVESTQPPVQIETITPKKIFPAPKNFPAKSKTKKILKLFVFGSLGFAMALLIFGAVFFLVL